MTADQTDLHGTSDEGTWIAYAPEGGTRGMSGLPESTYGPFSTRAEAEAFVAASRGTPWRKVAVNLSDYPEWFGPSTLDFL